MGKIVYDLCKCGNKKCNFSMQCKECTTKPLVEKVCSKCKTLKPVSDFGVRKRNSENIRPKSQCKKCEAEQSKLKYYQNLPETQEKFKKLTSRWRDRNPEKDRASDIRCKIRKMGLTHSMEVIQEKLSTQLVCEICKEPEKGGNRLSIDHCHTSVTFRGLLCNACNRGLGLFKDNPERLKNAAKYLEQAKGS